MRSKIVGAVLAAGVLAAAGSAEASKLFNFSYSGSGYSGSGVLETADAGSPYQITGITGSADGSAITGLSSYAGADNQLYFPGPPFFSFAGMSFSTAAAGDFNLFYNGSSFVISSVVDPVGYGTSGQPVDVTISAAGVPEPAAWSLMLMGFGGLGAVVRRRKVEAAA